MEVIFAAEYGFCMGVKRAVSLVDEIIGEKLGRPIATIGPLIHNNYFLDKLKSQNVGLINEDEIPASGTIAIIRTHGIAPQKLKAYQKSGVALKDATCPKVRSSQLWIEKNSSGRTLIVAGDLNHGEVVSLCGYCSDAHVVGNVEDAKKLLASKKVEKALLIAQTTFSQDEYQKIIEVVQTQVEDLLIRNSICDATVKRQNALKEILPLVDAVVVVGGKNSANTLRLVEIAKGAGVLTFHIEKSLDIVESDFVTANIKRVGITAGASTPPELINEVAKRIASF